MWIIHLNATSPLLRTELSNLAIPFKGLAVHGQVSPFRQNGFKFLSSVGSTKLPDLLVTSQEGRDILQHMNNARNDWPWTRRASLRAFHVLEEMD